MIRKTLTAIALAAVAATSQAGVVYNNGSTIGGGVSNNMVAWLQADNFTLTTAATITGGRLWIEGQGGALNWNGALQYWIFAGGATPGAVLQTGSLTIDSVTDSGVLAQGGRDNIRQVDFDLDINFSALANTQYYFGVRAGGGDVAWSGFTPGNGTESFNATLNNWFNNGRERAFLLNGNAGTLPEPATLALVGLTLAGAAVARRRKA